MGRCRWTDSSSKDRRSFRGYHLEGAFAWRPDSGDFAFLVFFFRDHSLLRESLGCFAEAKERLKDLDKISYTWQVEFTDLFQTCTRGGVMIQNVTCEKNVFFWSPVSKTKTAQL